MSNIVTGVVAMQPNIFSTHNNSHAQQKVGVTAGNLNLLYLRDESSYCNNFNTGALRITRTIDLKQNPIFDHAHLHLSAILCPILMHNASGVLQKWYSYGCTGHSSSDAPFLSVYLSLSLSHTHTHTHTHTHIHTIMYLVT